MAHLPEHWAAASAYEHFMGRWSRELARVFVAWLQMPRGVHWLDVGCGTGALTAAICACADPASVTAVDPAHAFIENARAAIQDSRVSFFVAGADDFPAHPHGYDSISSLLALNFFPHPVPALRRMISHAKAHATISACVWDYADGMQFLRCFWDAVVETDPAARQHDEAVRFPICAPRALQDLFHLAGLDSIRCEPIAITTGFTSFDDYWRPLLGGTGPAPSYVASLDSEARMNLKYSLQGRLPVSPDGTISLHARAWAIRGVARSGDSG